MKKTLILTILLCFTIMIQAENVFLSEFKTTHGLVPFDRIDIAHYEPAIMQGIKEQNEEIAAITANTAPATFENTIVALERSGATLDRVLGVYYAMLAANADDSLNAISERISPILSDHSNSITLNEQLWQRIKYAHDHFDEGRYDQEDRMLMNETYDSFVRSGANLQGADRQRLRDINKRLTELTLKFAVNTMKETAKYEMWLTKDDLSGLPESAIEAASTAAKAKGRDDAYLITLQAPSYMAFMKYSDRRDLREKLYKAYNSQCLDGEFSNMQVVRDIANTRLELAQLFGFKTFAEYKLQHTMAETPTRVMDMLEQLRTAYTPTQQADMRQLTEFASKTEGKPMQIMPWDYSYYSNKQKTALFDINDEMLRPYFELSSVIDGVFGFATRMYGLHFTENHDAQVFNPEIKVFDVTDEQGKWVGALYTDFFPRDTKKSGAWMTDFREQHVDANGNDVRPLVTLTMNFTRPTLTKPSLLTYYEVETFMHEFGHALHSLLSKCKYSSLSGTNVYHDFVETPSQFNENYMCEREFLDGFARHYVTGEKIPQELINKVIKSSQYGAAYSCLRQLGFGYLDMAWHGITKPFSGDVKQFEYNALEPVKIFDPVEGCALSPQFNHIFSGGYAAGYYGYKWSEMIEADAFSLFQENGIFDQATAHSFRDNILSRGGTEPPMTLYKRFRGREPKIDALMRRDGITR